jgi:hypothetical protein
MGRKIRNTLSFDNRGTDWSPDLAGAFRELDQWKALWNNVNSCVRLFGGIIQDNGDGTVRTANGGGMWKIEASSVEGVPAGECEPMTLNGAQGGKLFYADFDAVANLNLTNNAYNYIFVTWDHSYDNHPFEDDGVTPRDPYDYMEGARYGGPVVISNTNFYMQDWETDNDYLTFRAAHPELNLPGRSAMLHAFTIGRVYKMDREITIRVCGTNGWNFNKRLQLFGEEFFPVIRARGLDIEPVEGPGGELQYNVTEGVMWAEMINRFTVRAFNMELGDTFYSWYQHTYTETDLTLSELETTYPNGFVADGEYMRTRPYDIWYSTTEDKYYRDEGDYYESRFNLDGTNSTVDPVTQTIAISTSIETMIDTSSGQTYKILIDAVGGGTATVGDSQGGSDLASVLLVAGINEISVTAPDTEVWLTISGAETISSVEVQNADGSYTYWSDNCTGNISNWSEVVDYIMDKLILSTSYTDESALRTANPDGYFNMSEDHPTIPGHKLDYVVLQLQATDAYYQFDQDAREWVYYGPKSSILPTDTTVVAFIGNVAGMNEQHPDGFQGKINAIIATDDGKYWEYSGVEGVGDWIRVHGFVERNGWLRFYGQDNVDAFRYNDLTANGGQGALADIPDGRYGVAWIYMVHDNTSHVVYGQDHYTAEGAKNANLPAPLPGILAAYSTLVGKMTFLKGATTYENAESPFLERFVSSGVSLHNDLAGLDGGDAGQNKYYHLNEAQYNNVVGATKPNYNFQITNGMASTSTDTGALVVTGGVGISGELYVGNDITAWASSDSRLKDDVKSIDGALEKLLKIGGYNYVWNDKALEMYPTRTPEDVGVIAQEIQEVIPEAVIERENGYLAVDYDKLIPLLIESVKTLKGEVDTLKK